MSTGIVVFRFRRLDDELRHTGLTFVSTDRARGLHARRGRADQRAAPVLDAYLHRPFS